LDNPFYGQLTVTNIGRTGAEVFPGYPQRSPSAGRLAGIRPLIAISLALLVSLAALLSRERGRRSISDEGSRTLLLAALVAAAPVGMLGFSLISDHNVFQGRYLSASFPALALLVAGLICSVRPRVAAVVAAVVLVGVAAGTAKILSSDLRAAEYRKPARYVDAHARPGDVVVQKMRKAGPLSTALIVHFRRPHRVVTVTGVREVPGGYEGTVPPDVWRRAAAGHEVFVIGSEAPPLFFLPRPPKRWAPQVRLLERRRYPGVSRIYLYVYGPRSE
jgi:hypothetical protein